MIKLENEASNTGIFYLDKEALEFLLNINEFPFNLEDDVFISKIVGKSKMRCYIGKEEIILGKSWVYLKDEKDYNTCKKIDFEKFLGIKNIEELLGPYKPKRLKTN